MTDKPKLRESGDTNSVEYILWEVREAHARITLANRQIEANHDKVSMIQGKLSDITASIERMARNIDDLRVYCDHLSGK